MAEGIELILRFHPVGGEDVTVVCNDFASESEALTELARALDERRSLVLTQARYNRAERVDGVVINLANIVSARVSRRDSTDSGQYL
jgi:hypothetical protein